MAISYGVMVSSLRAASTAGRKRATLSSTNGVRSTAKDLESALRRNMLIWFAAHARLRFARLTFAMTVMIVVSQLFPRHPGI